MLAAVAAALLGAGAAAAAVTGSGSPAGIRLGRHLAAALAKVPVQTMVRRGYVWMASSEGRVSSFRWAFGEGAFRGEQPAVEHVVLRTTGGRVVWWTDSLTPPTCTQGGICASLPVEVLGDSHGLFYAFGNAARHTCFGRLNGATPFALGQVSWAPGGHFDAPVKAGADVRLTSSYPWPVPGANPVPTATEIDTISRRTHLLLRQNVSVDTGAPFAWSATFAYPASRAAPALKLCA